MRTALLAKRVAKGEELLLPYGDAYWKHHDVPSSEEELENALEAGELGAIDEEDETATGVDEGRREE